MRPQTKPFIVERKSSRKPRPDTAAPSIWGKLDLSAYEDAQTQEDTSLMLPVAGAAGEHR